MIVEFVHAYQLIFELKLLLRKYFDYSQKDRSPLISLRKVFEQLNGSHPTYEHSFWAKGSLTKLKEYCLHFSNNTSLQNEHHINLHMTAHQALLTTMHIQELLNSLIMNPYTQNSGVILKLFPIKNSFLNLQKHIKQMIRYFPKVLRPFWNNENVILCLLRIRTQLTEIYGSDFFAKYCKWPRKRVSGDLFQFLVQRFKERGFEALLPTIQQIFESERRANG